MIDDVCVGVNVVCFGIIVKECLNLSEPGFTGLQDYRD